MGQPANGSSHRSALRAFGAVGALPLAMMIAGGCGGDDAATGGPSGEADASMEGGGDSAAADTNSNADAVSSNDAMGDASIDGGANISGDAGPTNDGADGAGPDSSGDDAFDGTSGDAASDVVDGGSDPGTITTVTAVANGAADFLSPFDATPDSNGANVYFTAIAPAGDAGGVFKVAATGGSVTKLFSGDPLVAPFGIAITADGMTLFVADPGANVAGDEGQIYQLPVGGGAPSAVNGTAGYQPRSLEAVGTTLYFTGTDPANGNAGVFKISAAGGSVSAIVSGMSDPGGVTANVAGDVFFVDTLGSPSHRGTIYKVANGAGSAAVVLAELAVGYPAGLTLSGDGTALLASSLDTAASTDQLLRITIADGNATPNVTGAIAKNYEAAGIHRAKNAPVYAWCDSTAGGTGTVYLLK